MHNPDLGKLILRLTLGVLMLLHGVHKIFNGVGHIRDTLATTPFPELLAYGVYVGEVLAPLMVIVGFYTRLGAALMVVNMLFAIGLMHMHELFSLTAHGGWQLELQGFYLFTALALIFLGPGRYKWKH